ncbi:hypothetical protein ABZ470_31735 [Streptosporangium sp. NPDC020072]|uniref:Gp37-like protein n=1 Tax=Streptosporangium sp. NPDC020072 TaxID=3154788 RepID=UPI003413A6E4
MPKFVIEVRDPQYRRVGLIEQYTRFEAIIRYCDIGSWALTIDAGLQEAGLLVEGGGIIAWTQGLNQPLFSGPLKGVQREWNESNPGGLITFTGKTDELWLHERVIYPLPTSPIGSQTRDRDSGTMNVAGALSYFVRYNLGPQALPDRIHPYLTVADVDYGPSISVSARFDVLGEYLKKIAESSGFGFRVIQEDEGIQFEIFQPTDRSASVVFSPETGNLADYKYTVTAPEATRIIVGAQGEGRSRYLKIYSGGAGQIENINDDDDRITYTPSASWTYSGNRGLGDYQNDVTATQALDANAQLIFNGTGAAWYTEKNNDMGLVDVYLDSVYQATVDCYTSGVRQVQVKAWERTDLSPGGHVLRLINKSSGKHLIVDYLKVHPNPSTSTGEEWNALGPERFVDRRDIPVKRGLDGSGIDPETAAPVASTVYAELDQAGAEAVLEAAGTASLSVTPIDTEAVAFGRDYQLGDVVSVSITGETIKDVLREVRLIDTVDGGPLVHPVVGSADATETPLLYREVRKIWSAIRKLEARL